MLVDIPKNIQNEFIDLEDFPSEIASENLPKRDAIKALLFIA